ncbi:hypothetical protein LDENG_00054660 [Lucifuga dentata]|nr:hypothetical protein LDENG_00054660 [Lucifuga dentata]
MENTELAEDAPRNTVLRLLMILRKQRPRQALRPTGGLLVMLWTQTGPFGQRQNCIVAAAGPWCAGIKTEVLQHALTDIKERLLACAGLCPEPDPEELFAFTGLHGSLRFLLSFQKKDTSLLTPEWYTHMESFLHTFSLANAGIKIHLKFKLDQQIFQEVFSVKVQSKTVHIGQQSLFLDVTCNTRPPVCVKKQGWCRGGHPVRGGRLSLSIPPEAMDRGLYGELSLQPIMILSPCVLQYPNLATQLTHIQISFAYCIMYHQSTNKSRAYTST